MEMRPIPGYPGYQVTDDGRVWLERKGRFSKGKPDVHGYPVVNMIDTQGRRRPVHVHVLVLLAFVGPCPPGNEARHLNDIKTDTHLANLKWGTRKENVDDCIRNGHFAYLETKRGSDHPRATVTEKDVEDIRRRYLPRVVTGPMLAREYGVKTCVVYNIIHGTNWKHVA